MPHLKDTDGSLVLLTLSGDQTAYDELFIRYEKRVRTAAYSVVHNPHIAEDAAQDAFLAAWLKLDRLREPDKFGVWICRIAKNCALNMALRFRNYMSLDDIDGAAYIRSDAPGPEELLMTEEEAGLMRRGLGKLPERSQQVVYLHYYEGKTAEEIAELMGISVGTVKSQLFDGRKKMRKELCAMDEKLNDTLLQKIHKKIEEVKNWEYKNSKDGFESVYKDVLKDIDAMPECREKYHALADVLMRGYWWLPGEKNDRLFERLKEAALLGKNDGVMYNVLQHEASVYGGSSRLNHIKTVQIPSLDPADFRLTIAKLWIYCGNCTNLKNPAEALEAFDSAIKLLTPSDALYYFAVESRKGFGESSAEEFISDIQNREYSGGEYELLLAGGPRKAYENTYDHGYLYSHNWTSEWLLGNLFRCDGTMTADIKIGEKKICSDGSTLTFESGSETVETPAGTFTGCEVWTSRLRDAIYRNWYKSGVGLVKQEVITVGISESKLLESYKTVGGEGIFPIHRGNCWRYVSDTDPDALSSATELKIEYCDGERAIATVRNRTVRKKYDENSWLDMILKTRSDYVADRGSGTERIRDVRYFADRACELAKTPYERAYAEVSRSVVKRIIETDAVFNPDTDTIGIWNFFQLYSVDAADGKTLLGDYYFRHCFEWKQDDGSSLSRRVLSNHIYTILSDAAGCIFDEQWKSGYSSEETRILYDAAVTTRITCADAGTVSVRAGSFENCLSVDTVTVGMVPYLSYRGGRRTYYFAPGVGIVKVEIYSECGTVSSYELTDYTGTGEGYFPVRDGMTRRYEDLGLTDGYEGAVEYTYSKDCDGNTVILTDNIGLRHIPEKISRYSSVIGEIEEQKLGDAEKYNEANLEGCCNSLQILLHQLSKGYWFFWNPNVRARRMLYNLRLIEAAGNGEVAPAFLAKAARICLIAAVAFIGGNEREEGYKYLELALDYAERWNGIGKGEKLSFGDESVFGGIVYIKGESAIELPDGTRREIDAAGNIDGIGSSMIYDAMTASSGWEWFDPARSDDRYRKLVERAKKLI